MSDDRIAIFVRGSDRDLNPLVACLKTLEINPPSVEHSIFVLYPDSETRIAELLTRTKSVRTVPYRGDYGRALSNALDGIDHSLLLTIHPDILFVNRGWCDAVYSTIFDQNLAVMGAQPFKQYGIGQMKVQTIDDSFIAGPTALIKRCGGFRPGLELHGHGLALQFGGHRAGLDVKGGDLRDAIAHMRRCEGDGQPDQQEIDRIVSMCRSEGVAGA